MVDFVNIATLDNIVEAQLLESVLTERAIPYIIRSFHDPAYDGLFQLQQGWGCVTAPVEFQKMILYILSDLRKDAGHTG